MKTALVPYDDQGVSLEGFAVYPSMEKRPAVIFCHAWSGRDDFICEKAKLVTEWGYVGFALDMYGKSVFGKSKEENATLKKPFIDDRSLLQRRLLLGLAAASSLPYVNTSRIAAVGYGFGGFCALDLARSGADIKGVVSVYGHFEPPKNLPKKQIKAKVLVLHGHDDPIVTPGELSAFEKEMSAAKVDWQAHIYGNAMHAFANPRANDPASGLVYNPIAAKRAWRSIQNFLEEIFS